MKRDGTILGMRLDDLAPVGPFSMYPRSSVVESGQILRTTPGPYRFRNYEARGRVVFQNKTPMSQYRAVGHPVAALVMEAMVDRVARELKLDPVEVRRRNLLTADMYPYTAPTGLFFEKLSHEESLDAVLELASYRALGAERDRLRARGVYRGLGLCVFIDLTVPGAQTYGTGGARISSQDGTTIRLEPSGKLTVLVERHRAGAGHRHHPGPGGRGRRWGWPWPDVRVVTGDTMVTPYGGGTWGSRGRRHRRRGHAADGQGAEGEHPQGGRGRAGDRRPRPRHPRRSDRRRPHRRAADAALGAGSHRLLPSRHAAQGFPVGADGDAPLRAAPPAARLHQRRAALLRRGRRGHRRA